jgi:phage shock protein PspC (stress-responsive transcriptional regulator)
MVPGRAGDDHGHMQTRDRSTTTTDTTTDTATPRRITRSGDDRILGGVCGGIARHLDIDPVIVRIATVALVCAVGAGAVAYLAAWILMPLDDRPAARMPSAPRAAHA